MVGRWVSFFWARPPMLVSLESGIHLLPIPTWVWSIYIDCRFTCCKKEIRWIPCLFVFVPSLVVLLTNNLRSLAVFKLLFSCPFRQIAIWGTFFKLACTHPTVADLSKDSLPEGWTWPTTCSCGGKQILYSCDALELFTYPELCSLISSRLRVY